MLGPFTRALPQETKARITKAAEKLGPGAIGPFKALSLADGKGVPLKLLSGWSQGKTALFDFDELDDIEEVEVRHQQREESEAQRRRIPDSSSSALLPKDIRIVSAFTGSLLCTVEAASMRWRVVDVKARVAQLEGTEVRNQQLLMADGSALQDETYLADVLPQRDDEGEDVELLLVRAEPSWAGLLAEVARGEVLLEDLDETARSDREVVLAAVRASKGRALALASAELRADRGIVLEAVRRNGLALRHAAEALQRDADLVMAAVREWPLSVEIVQPLMRSSEVVLAAVRSDVRAADFLGKELLHDPKLALRAASLCPKCFAHLPHELRSSRSFVRDLVERNGCALAETVEWQGDAEVALTAMAATSEATRCVSSSLLYNADFLTAAVEVNPLIFEQLPIDLRNNAALAHSAVRRDARMTRWVPSHLQAEVVARVRREAAAEAGIAEDYTDGPVWWVSGTAAGPTAKVSLRR